MKESGIGFSCFGKQEIADVKAILITLNKAEKSTVPFSTKL